MPRWRDVFDAAFALTLLVALVRSVRLGYSVGIAAAVTTLALLVGAGASAVTSVAGEGSAATPLGMVFVGPSAILHTRTDVLAPLASPVVMALAWLALTLGAGLRARALARDLNPDLEPARRLATLETAFIGASAFAGIRLVTIWLFHALVDV